MWPHLLLAQHTPPSSQEVERFAERARAERNTGKSVHAPDQILHELTGKLADDYVGCDREDRNKLEAHQIILKPNSAALLAIRGQSLCFCGATGNCAFWVYQRRNGKYRLVLETNMVQIFGFLKSHTHGYPDLVTWSHDSASESSAELFRFDGTQYIDVGGWEEEYEYLDKNDGMVKPDKPRITSHFSSKDAIPQLNERGRP
jgi:hypothetical protein